MLKRLAVGAFTAFVAFGAGTGVGAQTKDIVQTAVDAGSFKTLARALEAAGLVQTLKESGMLSFVNFKTPADVLDLLCELSSA